MAADVQQIAELRRDLADLAAQAERLAGRARALETVVERYGNDGSD